MKVVVALAGSLQVTELIRERVCSADLVIAADGGISQLASISVNPDKIIGDFDSIDSDLLTELQKTGTDITPHPSQEENTDGQVAIDLALDSGATEIILLGANGGPRIDHMLANFFFLVSPLYKINKNGDPVRIEIIDGWTEAVGLGMGTEWENAQRPSVEFMGSPGDYISLVPISMVVSGIRTTGLRWSMENAAITLGQAKTISNELALSRGGFNITSGIAIATHQFQGPSKPTDQKKD